MQYLCRLVVIALLTTTTLFVVNAKSDPGKTETVLVPTMNVARTERPFLANSTIHVKIICESPDQAEVLIYWTLAERDCWYDGLLEQSAELAYQTQLLQQNKTLDKMVIKSVKTRDKCAGHLIVLPEELFGAGTKDAIVDNAAAVKKPAANNDSPIKKHPMSPAAKPIVRIPKDAIYDFRLVIEPVIEGSKFSAPVTVEIIGPHGYISATDWPLLPFYGIMCSVYVVFGIIWLVVSFMQWRDLLRIQFWIGGVILLGMLEKAFFYAQYHSLNTTGVPVQGAELTAEFVSCAKRTLARMLVIIMSLGFGIVKPRLGPMLHRVVGVGGLYFVLACVESYLRVTRKKNEERSKILVASIPLAVLDTVICWWIFTSLVQTTRTLRLRRNMVKLSLYRHFTNILIFSVLASVIFMLYAMRLRKTENCTPGWEEIWMDTAFWHVLFSVLLLVIMILWRPTNNNQRYAFTPLLDNPEDEDDDEEDQFVADAYGVKMRGQHSNGTKTPPQRGTTTEEDDLRWVEENIPSSIAEPALPILDSDEETMNTKFEVSKMQ